VTIEQGVNGSRHRGRTVEPNDGDFQLAIKTQWAYQRALLPLSLIPKATWCPGPESDIESRETTKQKEGRKEEETERGGRKAGTY